MSWPRAYMGAATRENIRHVANSFNDMSKKVILASFSGEDEEGPITVVRGTGENNDAQHILDQNLLDDKEHASKRSLTSDHIAQKGLKRTY